MSIHSPRPDTAGHVSLPYATSPLHKDFTVVIVIDRLNYGMTPLCATYKQFVCHVLLADAS